MKKPLFPASLFKTISIAAILLVFTGITACHKIKHKETKVTVELTDLITGKPISGSTVKLIEDNTGDMRVFLMYIEPDVIVTENTTGDDGMADLSFDADERKNYDYFVKVSSPSVPSWTYKDLEIGVAQAMVEKNKTQTIELQLLKTRNLKVNYNRPVEADDVIKGKITGDYFTTQVYGETGTTNTDFAISAGTLSMQLIHTKNGVLITSLDTTLVIGDVDETSFSFSLD